MAFDPASWAVSFVLGKATQGLLSSFKRSDTDKAFKAAVIAWKASLPEGIDVHLEALFALATPSEKDNGDRAKLSSELQAKRIPSVPLWHKALLEQWHTAKEEQGDDGWSFFELSQAQASEHLSGWPKLSTMLVVLTWNG